MSLRLSKIILRPQVRGFLLKDLLKGSHNGLSQTPTTIAAKTPPFESDLKISLAALNINTIKTPPPVDPAKSRTPPPFPVSRTIELPQIQTKISYEDQVSNKTVEDPKPSHMQEKQAARLIVIRRKKMKKHKLRKLRKKMKFEWAKIRQRREMKKEKLFQAGLIEKINLAEAFDPAKYAAEKITKAKEVDLPKHWYGHKYPEFIIKQLIEEKEAKEKEMESDKKRRASMSPYVKDYLKNLPK